MKTLSDAQVDKSAKLISADTPVQRSIIAEATSPGDLLLSNPSNDNCSIEKLGETCIDGGWCHHSCSNRCFRRECCNPFSDYDGPWTY